MEFKPVRKLFRTNEVGAGFFVGDGYEVAYARVVQTDIGVRFIVAAGWKTYTEVAFTFSTSSPWATVTQHLL